ncbi:MAG TPA: 4-hydroxybenzoyl-CoA reductase subunit gamma [Elusimicrobia bacterium]|nr:4-hydroxybenzoyl-CoA reductase subunit gamma [Elusimicrobiota bacterium]
MKFVLNGTPVDVAAPPLKRLLDVLREECGLTGTKEGCGEGECGACTVLLDGAPVNSCLIPVCQVEGHDVRTIESMGSPGALSPLQELFLETGGTQCGMCTPGMVLTAHAYVESGGQADPDAIRSYLAGNLCRCTGYQHIVDAVLRAVKARRKKG